MRASLRLFLCGLAATLLAAPLSAAGLSDSLKKGTVDLKSAGPMGFGPEGILFIGDPAGAQVFAIGTGDTSASSKNTVSIEKIDDKIASLLGTTADQLLIVDMKVNPASGNIYFSVARGKTADATPVLVKVARDGKLTEFGLKDVPMAKVAIPAAKTVPNQRSKEIESITSISFVKDKVIVAGLATDEFASRLRVIPFPFAEGTKGTSIEIFHGAHGKFETNAPVRTFVPYDIAGQSHLLAAYTCTPLVKLPIDDLKPDAKVKGVTVAELGNGNRPLDMVIYNKDGKDYALMANSRRGVMKVSLEGVDKIEAITKPVKETAGLKYDTLKELEGVVQLDKLDGERALLLVKKDTNFNLETIPLP